MIQESHLNEPSCESLLDPVRTIARAAGKAILEVYDRGFGVELKDDRSPLTEADRAAHDLIAKRLAALAPRLPLLSEEGSGVAYAARRTWQRYWLVDPLDGTKEFIKRNGEFTVNIALIDRGRAVLGVVLAPALDLEYSAAARGRAFRRRARGALEPIRVARPAADPPRVVCSRSHASDELEAYLERLGPHVRKPMGSAIKICLVAEGAADVYPRLGPTSEWDTAAAQAILECAGGSMIDLEGQPVTYNSKEGLLNPSFLAIGDTARDWLAPVRSR
ncbi:MAG TPA: 3'(2'),5'-bisphosphate nucleotidase CysQ [Gammaproteobacteria bacterium]|jgi:3'(2'), 5'-bisphosphate nucleotidase